MNKWFEWKVFTAPLGGLLPECLDTLYQQLVLFFGSDAGAVSRIGFCRVFLSDAANQQHVFHAHPIYRDILSQCALSCIEQPCLDGSRLTLLVGYASSPITKCGTSDCMKLTAGDGLSWLFQSVRFTEDEVKGWSEVEQTQEAFRRHIQWLAAQNLTLKDHCVRTWIYVRDIDNHYAGVVKARNEVFAREGLSPDTHFIASTGIGGACAGRGVWVSVDFLSVVGEPEIRYLHAPDYLNPTHEYGVAFERGTALTHNGKTALFISGTASIDSKGRVLYVGHVMDQTERLFVNIEQLLADGGATWSDVAWMTVYLRDVSDFRMVSEYMSRRFPHVPCCVVEARVCRPEWLVEVECVAVRKP